MKELSVIVPFFSSLAVGLAIFPFYIKWLKSKQVEQYLREEGPKSHAAKAKTPTMGGLGFIVAIYVGMIPALIMSGQAPWASLLILGAAGACATVAGAAGTGAGAFLRTARCRATRTASSRAPMSCSGAASSPKAALTTLPRSNR